MSECVIGRSWKRVAVSHAVQRDHVFHGVLVRWAHFTPEEETAEFFAFNTAAEAGSAAQFAAEHGCIEVLLCTQHSLWSPNLAEPEASR